MNNKKIRGRGVNFNPQNRFEKFYIEEFEPDELDGFYDINGNSKIQTQYFKDNSKSVIAKNDSYDLGFDLSFNPYRGCEHGCVYCYARPTHEYLGFSAGTDFETKIMIKEDSPELLKKYFENKNYKPDKIIFSGNTDCYQPLEKKLEITRKSLQVCLVYRNPVSLITKNALVQRDIDILEKLAELNLVTINISITTLDRNLQRKMEPRTSSPENRLRTIEFLAEHNIPVGVNVAPIIPGLTEDEIPEILKSAADRGAKFAGHILLRLPHSVKDIFIDWIRKEFPDKAAKIENKIRSIRGGKLNEAELGKRFEGEGEYAKTIHNLFEISCKKFGLNETKIDLDRSKFSKLIETNQIEMF